MTKFKILFSLLLLFFSSSLMAMEPVDNREVPSCNICLEDFDGVTKTITLPCATLNAGATDHAFHIDCIAQWLDQQGSCPLCRVDYGSTKNVKDFLEYWELRTARCLFLHIVQNPTVLACLQNKAQCDVHCSLLAHAGDYSTAYQLVKIGADYECIKEHGSKLARIESTIAWLLDIIPSIASSFLKNKDANIECLKKVDENILDILAGASLIDGTFSIDAFAKVSYPAYKELFATFKNKDLKKFLRQCLVAPLSLGILPLFDKTLPQELLYHAAHDGNIDMIADLIHMDAKIDYSNNNGETACMIALKNKRPIAALFIKAYEQAEFFKQLRQSPLQMIAYLISRTGVVFIVLTLLLNHSQEDINLYTTGFFMVLALLACTTQVQ